MRISIALATLAALGLATSATGAAARPLHHHRHYAYHHAGHGYAPYGYSGGAIGDGQIIEDAAARAQREPGVTSELAPDAKQSATGGPSGGVPGFSR